MEVPDIKEYQEKIVKAGGKIFAPPVEYPGAGSIAYMVDTEGNRFGLWKQAEKAPEGEKEKAKE